METAKIIALALFKKKKCRHIVHKFILLKAELDLLAGNQDVNIDAVGKP